MSPTRREFLQVAGAVGAGVGLGALPAAASPLAPGASIPAPGRGSKVGAARTAPKRLLILGGTGFIGPNMVRYAVERGHEVSIFTRGRSDADIPDVEQLVGDRNNDLSALEGRTWDVVLDNNARDYRWVQRSTEVLKDAAEHYLFVSSISAYAGEAMGYEHVDRVLREPIIREDSPRFTPPAGWSDGDDAPYGLTKALSENIAHAAFPGRTTVVRPGLIVGPGDPTDRFTYWPLRIHDGGEVLAPGNPQHAMQVIDQRDLTEWIVRLAENGTYGDFNATGPAARLSMAEMLYGIRAVTSTPVSFTWVPETFLQGQGARPWSDLPAWIPGDPLSFVDVSRAVAADLTFRPLADTARDTLEWDATRPAEERANRQAGMTREREREILAAWHARGG
ncbi:MAG TPA: NAD-dependent epimerase/dehydratase family protein [Longimicrobiales bacterium]|nr:NAD-dependent epimerase/dehydratase family protein [Longimicrobiales bacterium]